MTTGEIDQIRNTSRRPDWPTTDVSALDARGTGETTDFARMPEPSANVLAKSRRRCSTGCRRKAQRNEREREAAGIIQEAARASRTRFLRDHVDDGLRRLTDKRIAIRAGRASGDHGRRTSCRAWFRARRQIAAEEDCLQGEKSGLEIDQGIFLSAVLRSDALRPASLSRHAAAAAGGAENCCRNSRRRGWSSFRRVGPPRRQGRAGDAKPSALSQCGRRDDARRRGDLRRSGAARPRHARSPSCAAAWSSIRNTGAGTCLRRRHQPDASLSRPHSVRLVSPARSRLRQQDLSAGLRSRTTRRPTSSAAARSRSPGSPRSRRSPSAGIASWCW